MSKLSFTTILLFTLSTLFGQVSEMIIHETGGNTVTYQITNIDSITYTTSNIATCPSTFSDNRDGEVYSTIQIGNQCWMAENLRYFVLGSWLNPNNPDSTYGRLYNWPMVMNGAASSAATPSGVQGICPNGWHLPSDAEWNILEINLGMNPNDASTQGFIHRGTHGNSMKSVTGWNSSGNGTNSSGFNAVPAGNYYSGTFNYLGLTAVFRSSTMSGPYNLNRLIDYNNSGVRRGSNVNTGQNTGDGQSCRCLKN